jgi:23S rRNA pseudouridine2605 synthase
MTASANALAMARPRTPGRSRRPDRREPPRPASDDSRRERIAKAIARAGLASRREAEEWIAEGRVAVNGRVIDSPALDVSPADRIEVDGEPLPERERTRLWLYHKPKGLVTTERDPEGRPTVFETLPRTLPRVLSVGRLDINTEGLLLLTNDGGLKRALELPATGWLRRYKVRAFGEVALEDLTALEDGLVVDRIEYGPIEAKIERRTGDNVWLLIGIREGKNREVKNILAHLGLEVNRLIRLSYGPFQLGELPPGEVDEVPRRILAEQLGGRLGESAGVDLDGEVGTAPEGGKRRKQKAAETRWIDDTGGRATAKAERYARLQAGADEDEAMAEEDDPNVEIDPETGKISRKPKTVADRRGRRVAVEAKFDPDKAAERRRPKTFDEGGEEMRPKPRPPRREEGEDRPRPRPPAGGRSHSFRERGAPRAEEGLRRPREGGEERPRSFGYRDREGGRSEGGEKRKSFGFKDRGPPRGGEGERRPYRPREDRDGGGERRPYRPREEQAGAESGERKTWTPRIDRESGGERPERPYRPRPEGGERPRAPYRPREDRPGGGDRPRAPYRPRAEGEERPRSGFRPREDRPGGERPRAPYRPRGEGEARPFRQRDDRTGGGEDRPRRPYRPREEGASERPRAPYRPREDRPGGEDRPKRPYRPRSEGEARPYRPREDRPGGEDRPKRPYRPRSEGGERPRSGFRPREDRPSGGEDRPRRPYRPRAEGEERPRSGFRPREDRPGGEERPKRPFRPGGGGGGFRGDRAGGGPGRSGPGGPRPRPGGGGRSGGPGRGGPRGPRRDG